MKLSGKTDIGRYRSENQDCLLAQDTADGCCWGIVCDGMGGVQGGKLAAQIAVDTMNQYMEKNYPLLKEGRSPQRVLTIGVEETNNAIFRRTYEDKQLTGMGTTMVCACVIGRMVHIVHAGDSRGYLFRDGKLIQLTHDHSMVQELVDSGQLKQEQAANHPQKNLITKALGVDIHLQPDYTRSELLDGDILLLCTDGLCNMVKDEEMADVLIQEHFFDAADSLICHALNNGGQDNITVLLMGAEPTEEIYG